MTKPTAKTWYRPSDTPKDRLTFGVELEIALPSLLVGELDPNTEDPRSCYGIPTGPLSPEENARQHVAATLLEADIPAEAEIKPADWPLWKPQSLCSWVIKEDLDIWPPNNASSTYEWHAVELNSPPFDYSEEAVAEVLFVVSLLTNKYRCALTQRTALHIHVGNSEQGFDAETSQKLLGTYWTFEPLIEGIHPKFRIDNLATLSLRRGSVMMCQGAETRRPAMLPKDKRNPAGGLEWLLEEANCNLEKLSDATESYRKYPKHGPYGADNHFVYGDPVGEQRSAVNIRNLKGRSMKTVEFRQHTMTLNCERVDHWLRFCVGLVEFAGNVDMKALKPFLEEHVDGSGGMDLKGALTEIGLQREALYFGAVIEKKQQSPAEAGA